MTARIDRGEVDVFAGDAGLERVRRLPVTQIEGMVFDD